MADDHREWLLVREADGDDAHVDLGPSSVRIGRGSGNQVTLRDSFASTAHAELAAHQGQRSVRDLGSTNGTRLNGRPLPPGSLAALHDGDVIEIGRAVVTYHRAPYAQHATNGTTRMLAGRRAAGRHGTPVAEEATGGVAAPAPTRRRPLSVLGRVVVRLVLAGVLVALLLAGGAWLFAPSRVSVLVLGTDARPDQLRRGEGGRTDTILTVVADRSPRGIGLISLPRDLWVEIPGYGAERINVAYAVGGPSAAERVVGETLGVRVDRYLTIGLQGVRDVVDAAGGIEIDVAQPIHDDAYPTDDYGTIVIDIPAGRQHMDGETALRYARTRHQDSDFGRMARQQQVMVALASAMQRPTNWWRAPAVLRAVHQATQTDLGLLDLVTLAIASGAGATEPDRLTVGLGMVEEQRGAGGAFLLRPTPLLHQRVAAFLTPASATVEVLNGTATAGLATQTADRLRSQGVRVVSIGNAGRGPATVVEVRPGFRRAGLHVAGLLALPKEAVRESSLGADGADVRVTLGGG